MLDRSLEDTLPYLLALLGGAEATVALQQMDPQIRKRRTLEAIKRLLVRESLNQPLIIIFEDLHWLDNETQAFLSLLSESVASARLLLLVNYRPEYRHGWGSKTYYTQLRLDPLGTEDAEEMLRALLEEKGGALPDSSLPPLQRFILEKTEGNPFFMEEIVQALAEQGVLTDLRRVGIAHRDTGATSRSPLPADLHLPSTVQGVLAARIDRLSSGEKSLLQTLAVIGKEFPLSLLRQVVNQPDEDLQRLLFRLQEAEFIYEQPAFPEPEYTFKHALTQEVAYTSLLLERRRALHERTARAIEELFHFRLEEYYGDLAHHYSRSGNTQKAVEYLRLAGQQAVQRSANAEAITHLTAALEILKTLPDTPERAQHELPLQLAVGVSLQAIKGLGAPEVGQAYARARELCQQVGETPQLSRALFGLTAFYGMRGEVQTARELAEQHLRLAQSVGDPALLLVAHRTRGLHFYFSGEFAPAREQLEQALALYDPRHHRSLVFAYATDSGVVCLGHGACALWY